MQNKVKLDNSKSDEPPFPLWRMIMLNLDRITFDSDVMGGKPCLRGLRITAGMLVGLIVSGHSRDEILKLYPYLEPGDIAQALSYLRSSA